VHYSLAISKHVVVPETQHLEAIPVQISISLFISAAPLFHIVLSTVDFDYDPRRKAGEIYNQMIDGHLAAEVEPMSLQNAKLPP
jgi:hypothetical protein